MKHVKTAMRMDAPPDDVFAVMSDFANAARNISGITRLELLTEGEIGVGTRFRETRLMMKREATEEMEVTEFEPGKSYTLACESCGSHYSTDVRVAPDGSGSLVEMDTAIRPLTLGAKLMSPLSLLMSGMLRKCLEKDLEDVRAIVEAQRVTVPA